MRTLDPNFRINASSAAVILGPREGSPGARLATFRHAGPFAAFRDAVRAAARDLGLVPLMTFDPQASPFPDTPFLLRALVPAPDREALQENLRDLREARLS